MLWICTVTRNDQNSTAIKIMFSHRFPTKAQAKQLQVRNPTDFRAGVGCACAVGASQPAEPAADGEPRPLPVPALGSTLPSASPASRARRFFPLRLRDPASARTRVRARVPARPLACGPRPTSCKTGLHCAARAPCSSIPFSSLLWARTWWWNSRMT